MSDWLHVAAVFRIDYLRGFEENEIDFDKIFGKECLFESPEYVWDDMGNNPNKYLPSGSEGTLEKSVWINPNKSCMAAYTVSVFGDLRDADRTDCEEIERWFDKACNKLAIRQAVITISNDYETLLTKKF